MSARTFTAFFCWLVMLASASLATGQVKAETPTPQLIKCSISVASPKIERNKPASVSVTVENVSGQDIDLKTYPSFKLLKNDSVAVARNFSMWSDSYWSPLDISTGEPLKLIAEPKMLKKGVIVGRVPKGVLHLSKGEVKTFKVELGKLLWNNSGLNDWPHQRLFDIVEKGQYWLVLNLDSNDKVQSNKAEVIVE